MLKTEVLNINSFKKGWAELSINESSSNGQLSEIRETFHRNVVGYVPSIDTLLAKNTVPSEVYQMNGSNTRSANQSTPQIKILQKYKNPFARNAVITIQLKKNMQGKESQKSFH